MGGFHCPMGAMSPENDGCIRCGLCTASSREQAVAEAAFCAGAVLILGDGFAVVFTEAVQGGRDRYLLCEKELEI